MTVHRTDRPQSPATVPTRTGTTPAAETRAPAEGSVRAPALGTHRSTFEAGVRTRSPLDGGARHVRLPSLDPAALGVGATATTGTTPPVKNEFVHKVSGRVPPVAAGSFFTQIRQAAIMADLSLSAAKSVASGGRLPPDFVVAAKLRALGTTPPTNEPGKTTHSDYFSRIPGVSPDKAYEHFVNNFSSVFGAGGLKVRPETSKLQNGQRLMLELPGLPPVWFPIEVRLDPAKRQVNIVTLDGHPLRGLNQFTFADDGQGGTRINQLTQYQLSSKAVELAGGNELQKQNETWSRVHQHLFQQLHPRS